MWEQPDNDQYSDRLYLAGEIAPAGIYRQMGTNRQITLDRDNYLPASMDGQVACYSKVVDLQLFNPAALQQVA